MKSIYVERAEQSGNWQTGSPSVGVEVFINEGDAYDAPALIRLSAGNVTSGGEIGFKDFQWITFDYKFDNSKAIRHGIMLYDKFRARQFGIISMVQELDNFRAIARWFNDALTKKHTDSEIVSHLDGMFDTVCEVQ